MLVGICYYFVCPSRVWCLLRLPFGYAIYGANRMVLCLKFLYLRMYFKLFRF